MRTWPIMALAGVALATLGQRRARRAPVQSLRFERGYPTPEAVPPTYDDLDLDRAVQAYRFFYPTVSGVALIKGGEKNGVVANKAFGVFETTPKVVGFTYNSDTPYGSIPLDLSAGPMVLELPPGPLIVMAMDINQRWVADMGLPGPDAGNGGKHLLLPPGYAGAVPPGYFAWTATSNRMIVGARALPTDGDVKGALERLKTIQVHPLQRTAGWMQPRWLDISSEPQETTPLAWENNIRYWRELHDVVDREPAYEPYRNAYGDLAALGIAKGRPFAPDARMRGILERAAQIANAQMRVEAFADRRPDRIVWPDRNWEWAALVSDNGDFNAAEHADLEARDKWFYQAIGASRAMVRRSPGAGSVYWLAARERTGAHLDGGKTYKLTVPQPVPCKLFWSVTVYDTDTRSQVQTDQGKAALRSMFELKGKNGGGALDLYFGPKAPAGKEGQWIKTLPDKGWFVYFRVYGPEPSAFDGTWKPSDFVEVA